MILMYNDDYIILMIPNILCKFMLLMIIIYKFCILYLCVIKLFLIEKSYKTEDHYVSLGEEKSFGSKFLQLSISCYRMVGRSNEVSLSIFEAIRMDIAQDINGSYNVAVQGINCHKTSTFQEILIFSKI